MEKEIDWIKVINFSPIWNKIYIKDAAPLPSSSHPLTGWAMNSRFTHTHKWQNFTKNKPQL